MVLLSSYGFCSPIIAEKARKFIKPEDMTVLVIPFAGFHNESTAARELNRGLIPFGFNLDKIYVCDKNEPDVYKAKQIDLIYVPGGNPFKLLKEVQDCKLLPWILNLVRSGSHYFGVSSGADFACESMEYLKLVEDCDYALDDYTGLGLMKEKVLCHADQRDMATLHRVKEYDERKTIFLRNDELYVRFENGEK